MVTGGRGWLASMGHAPMLSWVLPCDSCPKLEVKFEVLQSCFFMGGRSYSDWVGGV